MPKSHRLAYAALLAALALNAQAQTQHFEGKAARTNAEACAHLQEVLASLKGIGPRRAAALRPEAIAAYHEPSYTAMNAAKQLKEAAEALYQAAEEFHEATESADPNRFTAAVLRLRAAAREVLHPCKSPKTANLNQPQQQQQ